MATSELDIVRLRAGYTPTRGELIRIVILMSIPMILSEISVQVISYIDAGMVGSLGPVASASVGLVNTSVWLIRLPMAWFLAPRMGLAGIWLGMATELIIRGIVFLVRIHRGKWLETSAIAEDA